MSKSFILAADIGGSHITASLVDIVNNQVVRGSSVRKRVNSQGTANEILEGWCSALREVLASSDVDVSRVGIAMPGPFDYENGISFIKDNNKYNALYRLNVKDPLSNCLNIPPGNILMMNDAACFLQGEVLTRSAENFKNCVGLTLGTGIGTAKCKNYVCEDADRWHTPFLEGILEDYLSTRWFVKRYHDLTGMTVKDVRELSEYHVPGNIVDKLFSEFANNLSAFLTTFIKDEAADAVIIGGNIIKVSHYFLPQVERSLLSSSVNVPIVLAELGEDAAMIGAANCWRKLILSSI